MVVIRINVRPFLLVEYEIKEAKESACARELLCAL